MPKKDTFIHYFNFERLLVEIRGAQHDGTVEITRGETIEARARRSKFNIRYVQFDPYSQLLIDPRSLFLFSKRS